MRGDMMWKIVVLTTLSWTAACHKDEPRQPAASHAGDVQKAGREVKIWLYTDGTFDVNGARSDLSGLEHALKGASAEHGHVAYGRDEAASEPHPNAMSIIALI